MSSRDRSHGSPPKKQKLEQGEFSSSNTFEGCFTDPGKLSESSRSKLIKSPSQKSRPAEISKSPSPLRHYGEMSSSIENALSPRKEHISRKTHYQEEVANNTYKASYSNKRTVSPNKLSHQSKERRSSEKKPLSFAGLIPKDETDISDEHLLHELPKEEKKVFKVQKGLVAEKDKHKSKKPSPTKESNGSEMKSAEFSKSPKQKDTALISEESLKKSNSDKSHSLKESSLKKKSTDKNNDKKPLLSEKKVSGDNNTDKKKIESEQIPEKTLEKKDEEISQEVNIDRNSPGLFSKSKLSPKGKEDYGGQSSEFDEEESIYSSVYSSSSYSESEGGLQIDLDQHGGQLLAKANLHQGESQPVGTLCKTSKGKQMSPTKNKGKGKGKSSMGKEKRNVDADQDTENKHADELDHSFREYFSMNLMKNLKCNVFYDVFCYSMPKTDELEIKYKNKVNDITEFMEFVITNSDFIPTSSIPSKESLDQADAIVQDMWKRYNKDENSNVQRSRQQEQDLDKEVDNDLPHSAIFVLSDMADHMKSAWPGQFLATVNPITSILSVSLFVFNSSYTPEGKISFANRKFTRELSLEITHNLEMFEMSRQLRLDIPLSAISEIFIFNKDESSPDAVLILKVDDNPEFFQRFVHTSAFLKNEWKKRVNFLPFHHLLEPPFVLCIGGTTTEISDLAALMVKSDENLKEFMEARKCKPVYEIIKGLETSRQKNLFSLPIQDLEVSRQSGEIELKLNAEVHARRMIILDILTRHKLITPKQAENLKENPRDSCPVKTSVTNNYLGGLNVHCCLYDYVNAGCRNVSELEQFLSSKLGGSAFGFTNEDLYIKNVEENAIDNMTVGEFLQHESFEGLYFSFCFGNITQSNREWHCQVCNQCCDWSTWHCPQCDHCTYGVSIPICSYCGFADGRTIIKPNSVFMKQVQDMNVPYDDIKEEWKLHGYTSDVPNWPDPCMDIKGQIKPSASFNLDELMCDQLGLLDPMAFLLGSEARGVGSRQGRRRQKYKKKQNFNPAAAGCVLQ